MAFCEKQLFSIASKDSSPTKLTLSPSKHSSVLPRAVTTSCEDGNGEQSVTSSINSDSQDDEKAMDIDASATTTEPNNYIMISLKDNENSNIDTQGEADKEMQTLDSQAAAWTQEDSVSVGNYVHAPVLDSESLGWLWHPNKQPKNNQTSTTTNMAFERRRKACYTGRWVVLATFVLNFCGLGIVYSAAVLIVPLQQTFPNTGTGVLSFLPSVYLSVGLFSSLMAGRLQDICQRYFGSIQPLFVLGSLCLGGGAVMMTYATTTTSLVWLGAALTGMGVGWTAFTAPGICVQWFNHRNRSTMLLFAMAGSGLGSYCYTRVMQQFLDFSFLAVVSRSLSFDDSSHNDNNDNVQIWRLAVKWIGIFSMTLSLFASIPMRLPLEGDVEQDSTTKKDNAKKDEEDSKETDSLLDNFHIQYGNSRGNRIEPFRNLHQHISENIKMGIMPDTMRKRPRSFTTEASSETVALSLEMRGQLLWMDTTARTTRHSLLNHNCSLAEFEALGTLHVNYKEAIFRQDEIPCAKCAACGEPHVPNLSIQQILWTRTIIVLYTWSFLSSFAFTSLFVHLPSFAESVGLTATDGASALSYAGVALLLGNITLGWITDRIGPIRSLQSSMIILVLLMIAWPFCNTTTTLSILAFLYGYCATTQSSVPLLIIADAFGETSPDGILTLLGMLNVCKLPGYLLGPAVVGSLYDSFGNYTVGSIFLGATMLVANVWLFFLPSPQSQMERIAQTYGGYTDKCVKTCLGAHHCPATS